MTPLSLSHFVRTTASLLLGLCFVAPVYAAPSAQRKLAPSKARTVQKVKTKTWNRKVMAELAKMYGTFPKVTDETLAKTKRSLPADFPGKVTFVMLGFARSHQKPIETWLPFIAKLRKKYRGLDYIAMPLMGGLARLFGGVIKRGMRKIYKTRDQQLRYMPTFSVTSKITKSLRIRDTSKIILLLVDRKGRVFWKSVGSKKKPVVRSLYFFLNKLYTQ